MASVFIEDNVEGAIFEDRVEAMGGDLFVDDLRSSRPDDRRFVVPKRLNGEPVRASTRRVEEATAQLRRAARLHEMPPS